MSKIEKFEDLIAWQKARILTKAIYTITRAADFSRDFGLAGQIQRATVSAMSNIAEGFERAGLKEFHKFLSMAKSSCAEVRSHLYVALDLDYLTQPTFQKIKAQAEEVARIIGGLRASVQTKIRNQRGNKKQR
jgi:four helix bundle protein